MNVYILCGLIGSGKSTWAKEKAKESNTVIINKDNIRSMLKGDYVFHKDLEPLVKEIAYDSILESVFKNFDVIIDETNLTKKHRADYISLIKSHYKDKNIKINIVYFTEKENNVDRRMNDPKGQSREVWQKVHFDMLRVFEEPTSDEADNLIIVAE